MLVSNKLIVVSNTGYREAISPYTGQLLGRVKFDGGTIIAPVVANGTLSLLPMTPIWWRCDRARGRKNDHAVHARHRRPAQCRQIQRSSTGSPAALAIVHDTPGVTRDRRVAERSFRRPRACA